MLKSPDNRWRLFRSFIYHPQRFKCSYRRGAVVLVDDSLDFIARYDGLVLLQEVLGGVSPYCHFIDPLGQIDREDPEVRQATVLAAVGLIAHCASLAVQLLTLGVTVEDDRRQAQEVVTHLHDLAGVRFGDSLDVAEADMDVAASSSQGRRGILRHHVLTTSPAVVVRLATEDVSLGTEAAEEFLVVQVRRQVLDDVHAEGVEHLGTKESDGNDPLDELFLGAGRVDVVLQKNVVFLDGTTGYSQGRFLGSTDEADDALGVTVVADENFGICTDQGDCVVHCMFSSFSRISGMLYWLVGTTSDLSRPGSPTSMVIGAMMERIRSLGTPSRPSHSIR
ncbi:putative ligase-like domain containing protein [Pseudomonas phage vB_PseudoP-SA22]|nr:putative ligase-like domain containing protein [Pseudomonas phage vB_PseudoP-SA22]